MRTGAPLFGEHTREILEEHGVGEAEIGALEQKGAVVAQGAPAARERVA